MQTINTFSFSSEFDLFSNMENTIDIFWKSREQGYFKGCDGFRLRWCSFHNPQHQNAIIVVNGRTECIEKYKEFFFDLFQQGYDIYSFDHRGQGLSDRLVTGCDIGHVAEFEDYVDDLDSFIQQIVSQKSYKKRMMLANSMGGPIALLYVDKKNHEIDALALSSPMLGINTSPLLQKIAPTLCKVLSYFDYPADYAPTQAPFCITPFDENLSTHSKNRYQFMQSIFKSNNKLTVGGSSNQWVWQSMQAAKKAMKTANNLEIPLLLLQASKDKVVSNVAIFDYYNARQSANLPIQFEIIANANHELIFESDEIRNRALSAMSKFFDEHKDSNA